MRKLRLDTVMVQQGLASDASEALRLVLAHEVKIGDTYATSVAQMVKPDISIQVKEAAPFVSRGGSKLRAALDAFEIDVSGLRGIDLGCSTGGFSDCLLQAGIASLVCVDVGYGDLAWRVRNDARVTVYERTNIRTASPTSLGAPFDLVVADLSFIGLTQLASTFAKLCAKGGMLLALVKPQFESNHSETENGVVLDPAVRKRTVEEVSYALEQVGFQVEGTFESPVPGKKAGNIEYFVWARLLRGAEN